MRTLPIVLVILSGCYATGHEPPCWMQDEAERMFATLADTYPRDVDGTDETIECVTGFRISFQFPEQCDVSHSVACYRYDRRDRVDGTIYFDPKWWDEATETQRVQLVRHETLHRVFDCLGLGRGHEHPAWDYGNGYDGPASIVFAADGYDVSSYCEVWP